MTTATKIQKWGNSQGLRLPKFLLEPLRLRAGDDVEIEASETELVIRPARRRTKKVHISDLAARMPKRYRVAEEEWGAPVGKEVW